MRQSDMDQRIAVLVSVSEAFSLSSPLTGEWRTGQAKKNQMPRCDDRFSAVFCRSFLLHGNDCRTLQPRVPPAEAAIFLSFFCLCRLNSALLKQTANRPTICPVLVRILAPWKPKQVVSYLT